MPACGYTSEAVTLPKTRVWGSKEKSLHHFSATAPVSVELRWGCEESSEKTAVGSGVSFKYDPFGRRIQKAFTQNSTTTTTNYVYSGDDTVEETDQNGNTLAKYARTMNIDEPLAESRSGTTSYYEQDGLGSATSLTTAAGALANTYTFDSFGKTTNSTGALTNPFRYTGREFDTESSLYYYRARYYDPSIGRFISEDAQREVVRGMNFYEYVWNDPARLIDPDGRTPVDWGWWGKVFSWAYWARQGSSAVSWTFCQISCFECRAFGRRMDLDNAYGTSTEGYINNMGNQQQQTGSGDAGLNQYKMCNQGDPNCTKCLKCLALQGVTTP
jgi:RHS repeat-associated protein